MDLSFFNEALSGMEPVEVALGAGFAAVLATLMVIGGAVWFLVSAIGYFRMFQKAGQRSWFAFIPLLREYALFKMAWNVKTFWISTVLLAVSQLTSESENIVVSLVCAAVGIAWIVMQVKLVVRVAQSFGKGKGWAALLFFVPFITTLILGFGSAKYLGNPDDMKAVEKAAPIEQ